MEEYKAWLVVLAILFPIRYYIYLKFGKRGIIADLIVMPLLICSGWYFYGAIYTVKLMLYLAGFGISAGIIYSCYSIFVAIFWEPLKRVWKDDKSK